MGVGAVVLGAGSWGTALAVHLGRLGHRVALWGRRPEIVEERGASGERAVPEGARPAENLTVTSDLVHACRGAEAVIVACPSKAVREVSALVEPLVGRRCLVVSTAKGIERESGRLMTAVIQEVLGPQVQAIGVLSGPSFAKEVARGLPTAVTAAADRQETAEAIQHLFNGPMLRVYTSTDPVGVQVGGAVKNVIALAAGMSDGMELGANARAALITRGLAEVARLAAAVGADPRTISGLSGMGDLVLTCTGDLSRNRSVGIRLGRGESLDAIVASMLEVAEGVHNTRSSYELAHELGIEMPIVDQMYEVIERGKDPRHAMLDLMSRRVRPEIDSTRGR
jgi:glycerol-3-phosphate dehydrogenase (NAD(P)+)